jgi:phage gp36-like protein
MGTYATTTSIRHLLVNFYEGNSSTGDHFSASLASHHIARAEGQVNSKVVARYSLPFSPIPPEIRRIAEDIACVNIIRASNYQSGQKLNPYLEEFKEAYKTLDAIAAGEAALTYTDGSIVAVKADTRFVTSTEHTPIFGKDAPTEWERATGEVSAQAAKRT